MPLKNYVAILFFILALQLKPATSRAQSDSTIQFDFCGQPVQFAVDYNMPLQPPQGLSQASIQAFYQSISSTHYQPLVAALLAYKEKFRPDDWLFYQLIRKTAQYLSPKAANYQRYTLYKWFLLTKTGYDAILSISGEKMLLYVRCNENTYNIPNRLQNGKQYACLNYHDYGTIDFEKDKFTLVNITVEEATQTFSYKIKNLPDFKAADYQERDLHFSYNENEYHFKLKLNPQIQAIFANYPVVDYESFLNIPLSRDTYQSLIPLLKKNIRKMSVKNGVDYLMRFTRYAFLFETDSKNFGSEKRLSPEQTLLYEQSDCEDRVALFFCLVKEIYNLPMIVLTYPKHVTIAVQFDKPVGKPIVYNGAKYTVCEPTPQKEDLLVGQLLPELSNAAYEIAYAYSPRQNK